ncbi:hypothetical protein L1785_05615 [Antribacter sp. KLBMP9083]|uniref:Uncharacterized protein n=1 Tax=Antribacter soli TaxID=2910976 RepID=A0AA41U8G1_9MICO|nr:hypothetical protein [Antribacter soli]MCF4120452.1 hypothetical protein [Antribacter soli]
MPKNLVRAAAAALTAGLILTPTAAIADETESLDPVSDAATTADAAVPTGLNPISLTAVCDNGEAFLDYVIEPHPDAETSLATATWKYSYQGQPVGEAHGVYMGAFTGRLPWFDLAPQGDGWVMREYGIPVDDIDLYFSANTAREDDGFTQIEVTVEEPPLDNPCGPPAPLDVVVSPELPAGVQYPITACDAGPEDVPLPKDTEAISYRLDGSNLVATASSGYSFGWYGEVSSKLPWTPRSTAGNYFGYYDVVTALSMPALTPACGDAPTAAAATPTAATPAAAATPTIPMLAETGATVTGASVLAGLLVAAGLALLSSRGGFGRPPGRLASGPTSAEGGYPHGAPAFGACRPRKERWSAGRRDRPLTAHR